MGDISQFSVAAVDEHTSVQMAFSRQDELLGKISQIEKTLGQLLDWSKSITDEIGLLRPGPAITTTTPLLPSVAAVDEHTSGQMAFSRQDELLGKILQIKKTLDQQLDWSKSITNEIGLLRPGLAITTTTPLLPSVAAVDEHTSGQMAFSRQDELLGKISQIEKTLGQLLDWSKSITHEIGLLHPGPAITTTTPLLPSVVFEDCNSDHKADDFYPSLPKDWEQTSITVKQEEARSVCLFVSSCEDKEYTNTVYEVKFKHRGEVTHEPPIVRQVAKFREGSCLGVARIFSHSKLYCIGQDGGFIVDTRSWSKCSSIPPIPSSNSLENIVCAYHKVYYLACPSTFSPVTGHSFGRYNHDHKVWEQMTSFPFYDDYDHTMQMTGYAVCYGIILFSLSGSRDRSFGVVAFHVGRKDWNRVKIDTSSHCAPPFEGRTVVVGETIYALYGDARIKAFSFMGEQCDVNGISYALRQLFIVQGLDIARPLLPWLNDRTQYLVHLGNCDFFYVQTGRCDSLPNVQYLNITTFEIVLEEGGTHMIKAIDSIVHYVDIKGFEWFDLVFCFSPECKDYEPIGL